MTLRRIAPHLERVGHLSSAADRFAQEPSTDANRTAAEVAPGFRWQEGLLNKSPHGPLRVGVGGPVGSGKTALMDALCKHLRDRYEIAAITNDIYTKWDAEYLVRSGALAPNALLALRPAAVRTRRSARMPRSISPPSPTCARNFPISI